MKLSEFSKDRNNNFNLIRIAAAYAVLITHSFAIVMGTGDAEPLRDLLGVTLGSIAVDIFFITSGFLVTASLLARQSTIEFIWARILRIYPALFVMLFLTVFGMGLFFTTVPWEVYLSSVETYKYFIKCLFLFAGIEYWLPGVFEGNPYARAVNGSLWTMPNEVKMYAILVIIWMTLRIVPMYRSAIFKLSIIIGAIVSGVILLMAHFKVFSELSQFPRLFFMFFTGASFFLLKDKIVMSRWYFYALLSMLLLSTFSQQIFLIVYIMTLAYLLFFLAYIPRGFIRRYNQLGDYSYGVYIYAFPVQQSLVALFPEISVMQMVIFSSLITMTLAVMSWHFLEKYFLGLKEHYIGHTNKLLTIWIKALGR